MLKSEPFRSPRLYKVQEGTGTQKRKAGPFRRSFPKSTKGPESTGNTQTDTQRQSYRPLESKPIEILVKLPSGSTKKVLGENGMQIWEILQPTIHELGLKEPVAKLLDTGVPIKETAQATLLDGQEILIEESLTMKNSRSGWDEQFSIVEDLYITEINYCKTLRCVYDFYERLLRKVLSVQPEEYKILFDWVDPLCSLSNLVSAKLQVALQEWDVRRSRVGNIFSKQLWKQYEHYYEHLMTTAIPFLRNKETKEDEYLTLCRIRQGAAKFSLKNLLFLPVERLAQYERFLSQLAAKTEEPHPDYGERTRAAEKVKNMMKKGEHSVEESDLEKVQDLFPNDDLNLYEDDPFFPRKRVLRTRSAAASKLQRALSGKSKGNINEIKPSPKRSNGTFRNNTCNRTFVMEGPVHFTMGVQHQERHLFLFNDILLIAKLRSSNSYKLKEQILICEMWLSTCLSEVCESSRSPDTSFVLGWPTTNVVATFSSSQTKEVWHTKLSQLVKEAKEKEEKTVTTLQVSYWDQEANEEFFKTIKVTNSQTANDCIRMINEELGKELVSLNDSQLWVKTGKDDAPYPLIGHEYPFAIKMNFVRELLRCSTLDLQNFNNISSDTKCLFILRSSSAHKVTALTDISKKRKRQRKPTIIEWAFKKQTNKADSQNIENNISSSCSIFDKPLSTLCEDGSLPKPVMAILAQLFHRGPFTVGIFRQSANIRSCRELRKKLEINPDLELKDYSVVVLAAVFREFLRSLPDCLLLSDSYNEWLDASRCEDDWDLKEKISLLLNRIPPANINLLKHFMCVLWRISQNSSENKMSSDNLSRCIAPSILCPKLVSNQNCSIFQPEVSENLPKIIAYLIDHCPTLFGEDSLHLFDGYIDKDVSRQDSGAEESDSLHSVHGIRGYRQDDSSIDSLDRDLDGSEPSPKLPNKNKTSLTNLSRDSGLTLSDTQLYTPEEEVDSQLSNSGESYRSGVNHLLTKSTPHLDSLGLDNGHTCGKNVGISIDGSCNDVMRKRRLGLECSRSRAMNSGTGNHFKSVSQVKSHQPLQYSKSYTYSGQDVPVFHSVNGNFSNIVSRREKRGRSGQCVPMSAVEIVEFDTKSSLRRSASEESLAQVFTSQSPTRRPANHRKGPAPSPPSTQTLKIGDNSVDNGVTSKIDLSAWSPRQTTKNLNWKRSQSTSKIDEIDHSHDSSTLSLVSSDDSTPHVSRSNSRVRELIICKKNVACIAQQKSNRVSSVCSSSSETSQQTQVSQGSNKSQSSFGSQGSHVSTTSQRSEVSHKSSRSQSSEGSNHNEMYISSNKPTEPPPYREAITRKTHLRTQVTEQKTLSARARKLYEESVRIYNEQVETIGETHYAMPVTVDSGDDVLLQPPPLPPKPLHRIPSEGIALRLRHLPPVHVNESQIYSHSRRPRQSESRVDPPEEWRNEINWSVAQLRELFNSQSRQETCSERVVSRDQRQPPPYRPPPYVSKMSDEGCVTVVRVGGNSKGHDSVITVHKRSDSVSTCGSSTGGEESYV
ncbi:uncharacterized protein LOC143258561 [Tachypleus tridentatus]|uniref:uncharacterized protein LOC143258561 n=1 Tax=Tachypleus tridentatus TaxID=6853 RepID=UPI003FD2BAD8